MSCRLIVVSLVLLLMTAGASVTVSKAVVGEWQNRGGVLPDESGSGWQDGVGCWKQREARGERREMRGLYAKRAVSTV